MNNNKNQSPESSRRSAVVGICVSLLFVAALSVNRETSSIFQDRQLFMKTDMAENTPSGIVASLPTPTAPTAPSPPVQTAMGAGGRPTRAPVRPTSTALGRAPPTPPPTTPPTTPPTPGTASRSGGGEESSPQPSLALNQEYKFRRNSLAKCAFLETAVDTCLDDGDDECAKCTRDTAESAMYATFLSTWQDTCTCRLDCQATVVIWGLCLLDPDSTISLFECEE